MSERVRIAMLTTFYPPYHFGGDAIGVQRLATALADRGCAVTVVHDEDAYLMRAGSEPQRESPDPKLDVVGLRSRLPTASCLLTHQLGRPVVHGARLREILRPGAFDVIWYHNVSLVGGPGLLAYGDGIKIYEAHEHWLVCPTHVLVALQPRALRRKALPRLHARLPSPAAAMALHGDARARARTTSTHSSPRASSAATSTGSSASRDRWK